MTTGGGGGGGGSLSSAIENVASYRHQTDVRVEVEGLGEFTGDIAWGGNWFFLSKNAPCPLTRGNIPQLTMAAGRLRDALRRQGITGADGGEIDHVEFFGPPAARDAHSRNFVYCPGGAYDRSPCGTGTSAKLACLAADGHLAEGVDWVQESIIGSTFVARYRWLDRAAGKIVPTVSGTAYVTAEATLHFDENDPFRWGIC